MNSISSRTVGWLTVSATIIFWVAGFAGAEPCAKMAQHMVKDMRLLKNPQIAVLNFSYPNEAVSSGSSLIADRMMPTFVKAKNLRVIERGLVQKILEEKKLEESGVIDQSKAKALGSILAADILITGSLQDRDDGTTEVHARAIRADSGQVISTAEGLVQRTWSDRPHPLHPKPHPVVPAADRDEDNDAQAESVRIDQMGHPRGRFFRRRFR